MSGVAKAALVALLVLAAGGGYWLQSRSVDSHAAEARQASVLDANFADLSGKSRALSEWQGRLVVLNFWATWCPPCLKEMPAFVRLQQAYGAQGVQFIGIALDTREEVAKFVADHAIDFPILAGEEDVARYMQRVGNAIGALPFTVVVDRSGQIRHSHQGEWAEADAAAVIEGLLTRPAD